MRELHFKSLLRHKDAEIAYLAAKHEVERKRADAEGQRCRTLTTQVSTFSHTEAELRSQLNIYVEKFKQVSVLLSHILGDTEAEIAHKQQVEDTLNNSNELFLTFRKEMEEMSKKTKLLEKENSKLTKKHELVKKNILDMATERDRHLKEIDKLKAADTKMRNIIKTMQEQGRGGPVQQEMVDEEGTESEYDEEYDDEEEDESYLEGEEDMLAAEPPPPVPVFGPEPPPKGGEIKQNGTRTAAVVNGVKH